MKKTIAIGILFIAYLIFFWVFPVFMDGDTHYINDVLMVHGLVIILLAFAGGLSWAITTLEDI